MLFFIIYAILVSYLINYQHAMDQLPNGSVKLVNLPSSLSLFARSWGIYKILFSKLAYLSFLFILGLLINSSLTSFLTVTVGASSDIMKSAVAVLNTAIGIALTIYGAFIIAAIVFLVKSYLTGKEASIAQSMKFAQEHFLSLFWVGLVYLFVLYGGIFGIILSTLFSVWYYFCIYIVLVDEERGFAALAKSHYLVRGLFLRTIGRYTAMFVVILAIATLCYLTLAIPVIGWLLFVLLIAALFLFAFPYYMVYDYLRYEDLVAVERNVEFIQFKGEKAFLIAFAIAGFLLVGTSWLMNVLPTETQKSLQNSVRYGFATIALPIATEMQKNQEVISAFFLKLGVSPLPTSKPLPPIFDNQPSSQGEQFNYDQYYNSNY